MAVSILPTPQATVNLSTPNASALGIFADLNPYGSQRVSPEPAPLFMDPFDGSVVDVTNRWATGGTQVPTQATGAVSVQATVGASVANNSTLISQPTFVSPGLGFSVYGLTVTLEATQVNVVQVNRFWGKGQVTSFAYTTPVTDGVGFEVEGTVGALQCVLWAGGTKYVINSTNTALISSSVAGMSGSGTALPTGTAGSAYGKALTWQGGQHRYAIFVRSDVIYWFIEGQEVPVAVLSYLSPQVQTLPIRIASITNNAATSLAHTFQIGAMAVHDSTSSNRTISDATFPWRRGQVGINGGQSVKSSTIAGQSLAVTAATPVVGTGLAVAEAGSATFVVKNTVAATAFTGNPVIAFQQSDDNVSWGPLPVVRADTGTVATTHTLPAGGASTELLLSAELLGVNWIRVNVTTAQAANGMTVVTTPSGLPSVPVVAAQGLPQSSTLVSSSTAAISTALTATLAAVAGQFHYITAIEIQRYAGSALTGAATPYVVTTTNLPGSLAWSFDTAAAIGVSQIVLLNFQQPLKSSAVNTATTIVAPLSTGVIWRINVFYYTAP